MSGRNIYICSNHSGLSKMLQSAGGNILTVWNKGVSQAVQKCLNHFDIESFLSEYTGSGSYGDINLNWPRLNQIQKLKVFAEDIKTMHGHFRRYVSKSSLPPQVSIFPAGYVDGANCWHRDLASDHLSLPQKIAGIAIYNSHARKLSGEFNYIAPKNEKYMQPRGSGSLEYSCLRPSVASKMPLGSLGLVQHGEKNGLIHRATPVSEGYRWRVLFIPQ